MKELSFEEEKRIIKHTQKDLKHFAPLYKNYHKKIEEFFVYRVNSRHISEELTSQVFEKAMAGISNFRWQGVPFSAWLYKIARNTLIDHYRRSEKDRKKYGLDDAVEPESREPKPLEHIQTISTEDLLYRLLNELPSREREIIYMKFFDGYTNRLISRLVNLSESNVGTIVYRTLKKLRQLYIENQNEFNSRD